jgi:hypothetical protein
MIWSIAKPNSKANHLAYAQIIDIRLPTVMGYGLQKKTGSTGECGGVSIVVMS